MAIDKSSYEGLFLSRHAPYLRKPFLMNLFRGMISRETEARPEFLSNLRAICLSIVNNSEDPIELQQALSALAVVGKREDISIIESLYEYHNEELSIYVKACVYELTHG